jgi:hypothetical protein
MRPVLRLLGTRYGMALILAVLVLAVVGITRAVAGSYRDSTAAPAIEPSQASSAVVDPTAGDDSLVTPDSPAPPVTSPGAAAPDRVAADFVTAWLTHDGVTAEQWRSSFARLATATLRDNFKDTDPAGVPAQRITGPVVLQNRAATFVEATVPVDSGTVRLRMLADKGRWLVDGVDWERA